MFFPSPTLCLWIPSGWGQAREHGSCYLYRGISLTQRKAHRWYQGTGTPHGALGVAVGIGGWKSLYSFWKSVVTFHLVMLLGSFLLKHLPASFWSLSWKSDCCTLAPGAECLSNAVPQQHHQVCRYSSTEESNLVPKASDPVLSLVLVQHMQPVFFFCFWFVWGLFCCC